ncbi:MAG: glycine cleavage system protein GcvH [Alphaproteobacteria bacterium]|jgi:glycine cleavage system H protein|nr:glycine cleavage system protein GcvH [Alphaproteobacteria bacterium]MCK5622414.1 glycine cleavage system protein GcvH [Alphaproteobacteria bacterium]
MSSDLRYSEEHEWVSVDGDIATVGISDFAQQQLGDVVFIELPDIGRTVERGGEIAVVESVKAASEIYAPLSGEIVEVNDALADEPAKVNESPEVDGWLFKMRLNDAAEVGKLMDAAAYKTFTDDQG